MAGPHVRAACARHLRDLEKGPSRGLFWDEGAVRRVIGFFRDVLRLNGGEHEGKPFIVEPWQAFILGSVFGWKEGNAEGPRRFRVAFVETAKGSGKSPLAAGVGIYGQVADSEPRAEIYAAATKKDQALVLFRDAVAMVRQSPALMSRLHFSGGPGREYNIAHLESGSFFRAISSDDGQSGPRPHIALLDEIHEHKNRTVVDMMRAGTKGRRQALIFEITNSGYDRTSVCYDQHEYGTKVAAGDLEDDSFFAYICAVDEDDDPLVDPVDKKLGYPQSWAKANPSIGVTIKPKYIEEQVREAKGMPAKESSVRRLNFCQWVDAANPWIDGDLWRACVVPFSRESMRGRRCFGGLDLSGTRDLTAAAFVFPPESEGEKWKALVEFWTPADTLMERSRTDRVPYDAWVRDGYMHATPGRAVDYSFVVNRLGEISAEFDMVTVAYDAYHIKYLEQELAAAGIQISLTPHGQGMSKSAVSGLWMTRSIQLLSTDILGCGIEIMPSPPLTWNSASAVIESTASGAAQMFDKRKSTGRIDGLVALAMARGAADDAPVVPSYEIMILG